MAGQRTADSRKDLLMDRMITNHHKIPFIVVLRIKQMLTCIQTDMHGRDGHIRIWCILEIIPIADTLLKLAVM